ncbi:RDD family protein [Vibrio mediterranei]|uniref:RDD family protein n=1 Tax=Vibrio mediterranei TaxID=689 RepID=UPI00148E07EA|nr:RDD family protein [Vibrio mediterranei]NOI26619.1 RDD family protein [Vibrio mediterranei]
MSKNEPIVYAGFWVRTGAVLIDTGLFLIITLPLLYWIYGDASLHSTQSTSKGWDVFLNWVFPFVATTVFWIYRSATPGKIVFKLRVVDAKTRSSLSTRQSILRYLAYYVSTIPLCLGFLWVVFNTKKQGWHDLIANTIVIRSTCEHSK